MKLKCMWGFAFLSVCIFVSSAFSAPNYLVNNNQDYRNAFPFVPVMFQNLLPLNRPAKLGESNFQFIESQIPFLQGFAGSLFLGPIYPQTVRSYRDNQSGMIYANTGNYWPSEFSGVDVRLGTKNQYIDMVQTARSRGINVIQDIDVHHIGYLPRTASEVHDYAADLYSRGIEIPAGLDIKKYFYIWGQWISVTDSRVFRQEGEIYGSDYEVFENPYASPEDFERALIKVQNGDLFGLKTLNLENPQVLQRVIDDHLWYIREAGVTQFRIDAAKHIRYEAMRYMLSTMKKEINRYLPGETPAFFLEYWTLNYHNMLKLIREMGSVGDQVYFFDYPLASLIRTLVIDRSHFGELGGIIHNRNTSGVGTDRLVPIWMDHDFFFPIYDGSERTVSQVAAGYALAYAMSTNYPHFYNGFEKPYYGKLNSPEPARDPIYEYLDLETKAFKTMSSMVELFNHPSMQRTISQSQVWLRESSANHAVIERGGVAGGPTIVFRISRSSDPGFESNGRLVWEYINNDISTRIFIRN